jgi:glycosyltransferase involved in cell wall biosynthesis
MHITAVLAIRNEEAYLINCLRHLVRNDIDFVIIDNGSSDSSGEICRRREFAANLVDVQDSPFGGAFSLSEQLQRKMEIIGTLKTDWVVHLDADEVMHSYREGEKLAEALKAIQQNKCFKSPCPLTPVPQRYAGEFAGSRFIYFAGSP